MQNVDRFNKKPPESGISLSLSHKYSEPYYFSTDKNILSTTFPSHRKCGIHQIRGMLTNTCKTCGAKFNGCFIDAMVGGKKLRHPLRCRSQNGHLLQPSSCHFIFLRRYRKHMTNKYKELSKFRNVKALVFPIINSFPLSAGCTYCEQKMVSTPLHSTSIPCEIEFEWDSTHNRIDAIILVFFYPIGR